MFYKYVIRYEDGSETAHEVRLDPDTLDALPAPGEPPAWARLENLQCPMCPLDPAKHAFCPVAANLARVTRDFSDKASTEMVDARVESQERTYSKKTSLQTALSSLIGLYMATSGCPVMRLLKPMARYHLPFATLQETVHRSVSSYLLRQYLRRRRGEEPDWDLKKLNAAYKEIEKLNAAMTDRVRSASKLDANYNAVIILDAFAKMVPWNIDKGLSDKDLLAEESGG